jgi:hypothetical protein
MAVFQISRIQLRRGKKNQGTGLPQLASGEMAWAIDTQELYIGNGAVGEGAPYVGNTKVLTEHDSLLDLANIYQYKKESVIPIAGTITRSLQDRLDDGIVNVKNFGIKHLSELEIGESPDQTTKLQTAIDELTKLSGLKSVTLELNPGEYQINDTINLPSGVRIKGAGKSRYIKPNPSGPWVLDVGTSIKFTGTGNAFTTATDSTDIILDGFSIRIENTNSTGILINNSENLNISNIGFVYYNGVTLQGISVDNLIGIKIISAGAEIKNNKFKGLEFSGLSYGVYTEGNVSYNRFDSCLLEYLFEGFSFGNLSSGGANYNVVSNSTFDQITRHGIVVQNGHSNSSRKNIFKLVGGYSFSIINFVTDGNHSELDIFERTRNLEYNINFNDRAYVREIGGIAYRQKSEPNRISLSSTEGTSAVAFRLPIGTATGYEIEYIYKSTNFNQTRRGTLFVTFDSVTNQKELVDEYEYAGLIPGGENAIKFNVEFESVNGVKHIRIDYVNDNGTQTVPDQNTFTYVYSMLS